LLEKVIVSLLVALPTFIDKSLILIIMLGVMF